MDEYKARFKCRLCKKEYRNSVTNDPLSPRMNEVHYCNDGSIGVADFIGWELQKYG